jgi:hypothetical protein
MMTVIVILNVSNPHWQNKTVRRFVNPDVDGLEIQETSVAIRESNQTAWQVIDKRYIEAMTILFTKDANGDAN